MSRKSRKILEKLLRKDFQDWIVDRDCWKIFWGDKELSKEYDVDMFIDEQKRGFIIMMKYKNKGRIVPDIKNYIQFAFVYRKYRRKGVMKNLMKTLEEKYKGEDLSLHSMNAYSDKAWEYFGFKCIKKEKDCDDHEYILLK